MHTARLGGLDRELQVHEIVRVLHTTRLLEALDTRQEAQGSVVGLSTAVLLALAATEIRIVAGEVLKWSVNKQGQGRGEPREGWQFEDSNPIVQDYVWRGCCAFREYGLKVNAYKAMAVSVFLEQHITFHFDSIGELDRAVVTCIKAMNGWPELADQYQNQCKILLRYEALKAALPECFC